MSERILSFAYLMCLSFSGPKALKNLACDLPYSISVKSVRTKIALIEKIFRKKKFADRFLLFVLIYPLSKLGAIGQIPCVLTVYSVRCRWKNWFEKIAPNVSIRRVIFACFQNLKPPFLCQYLIFFNDFFFTLEISFGSLLSQKNRNLKKIVHLKVYCNLKQKNVSSHVTL